MSFANAHPLIMTARRLRNALVISIGVALVVACTGVSLSTQVISTWKDPKYASAPLTKIVVIS
jgi:hypothetical protein